MNHLSFAVALAFVLSVTGVSFASAQSASKPPVPSIAIVDVEGVMRNSLAMKSVRRQMDVISKDLRKSLAEEEKVLREEEQGLQQKRAILLPEKYAEERQALQQRAAALQQRGRSLRQNLDRGMAKTVQRIQIALFDEIGKLAKEMDVNLVLPQSQIVVAVEPFNISKQSLERLDGRLTEVDMVLELNENK
ncbi:MAG: OmpH family outer membrane protein [Alphaproteobacteria bacterium]|nr:OmpH family outer membrane protein [Alphaproteobacteria bacterium]